LKYYQLAIDQCPEEIVFYSNKAAVYFEMKDYENCIASCDAGIETTKGGQYDYIKLSKAMARKGNALLALKKYDESISIFQSALLEN
jgi:stress-induced-phosphoprotein 1